MKTREFDPVRSAALRNELTALAEAPARPRRITALGRPQVWVTAVTAIALLLAVVGVLRFTPRSPQPAATRPAVIDPLVSVTTPGDASYVARAVDVLLHARGTGTGTRTFDVPPGTGSMTVFIACTPGRAFTIARDGERMTWGTCERRTGSSYGVDVGAGRHTLTVRAAASTDYAVLAIRTPGPTIAAGAVIDPLAAVRDRHTPDALVGDTRAVLQASGTRTSGVRTALVPEGVRRLRVLLVCAPSSAATRVQVDGHRVLGCMNSVAHWFDLTPSSRTITAQVVSARPTDWRLLVVPAPAGATDSPANALLPYPATESSARVLGRGRGAGAPASGAYVRRTDGIVLVTTCRGTGWLEVRTTDGSTSAGPSSCDDGPNRVGLGGEAADGNRRTWTAIPHGDVSWTVTVLDGS